MTTYNKVEEELRPKTAKKIEEKLIVEKLEEMNFSDRALSLLDNMIWDECEIMRHKLTQKYYRLKTNYARCAREVQCAYPEFTRKVKDEVLYRIAYNKLIGKKYFNLKKIIRNAVKMQWILDFGLGE